MTELIYLEDPTTPRFNFTEDQVNELKQWSYWLKITEEKQGTGNLFVYFESEPPCVRKFCCLGIYINYRYPDAWKTYPYEDDQNNDLDHLRGIYQDPTNNTGFWESETLHDEIAEKIGLNRYIFYVNTVGDNDIKLLQIAFTELNDTLRWSFEKIAEEIDYIVEHDKLSPRFMEAVGMRKIINYDNQGFHRG